MLNFLKVSISNTGKYKKPIFITTGIILSIIIIITTSFYTYTKAYEGRVLPNVFIGVVDIGELTQTDATEILQQHIDTMLDAGVDITAEGQSGHIDLRTSIIEEPDLARDLIYIDTADAIHVAMAVGRSPSFWNNLITPISLIIKPEILQQHVEINDEAILKQLIEQFSELEEPALPADYKIDIEDEKTPIRFLPGKDGSEFYYNSAISTLWDDANDLKIEPLTMSLQSITYEMTAEDALSITDEIITIVESAPYYLAYTSETLREYSWKISSDDIADWIEPTYTKGGDVILTLTGNSYEDFIESISNNINIEPVNARFVMENNIVTEFDGSQNGIEFDSKITMQELFNSLGNENATIDITVLSTAPETSTADVNSFGITEIIGVGTSDFSGSPYNRIVNIKHGASKLNGLLIAPGETISLIDILGPFTITDGYLAELVIKGDEIKPEVGGGLCQIGTTAFRAVMNTGLQVDERRNHSLVVSYYNDPSNGNPGTDATIYDPYPDFKFTNDYENYILLTTDVDTTSRILTFTFWGTNDGRNGYYSAPVILSWSGYGETQYTETLDLAPGVTSCQSPHPGATTQFTYYVDHSDGTEFSETYTSVYRSLAMICLVGVEEISTEPNCENDDDCAEESIAPETTENPEEPEEEIE